MSHKITSLSQTHAADLIFAFAHFTCFALFIGTPTEFMVLKESHWKWYSFIYLLIYGSHLLVPFLTQPRLNTSINTIRLLVIMVSTFLVWHYNSIFLFIALLVTFDHFFMHYYGWARTRGAPKLKFVWRIAALCTSLGFLGHDISLQWLGMNPAQFSIIPSIVHTVRFLSLLLFSTLTFFSLRKLYFPQVFSSLLSAALLILSPYSLLVLPLLHAVQSLIFDYQVYSLTLNNYYASATGDSQSVRKSVIIPFLSKCAVASLLILILFVALPTFAPAFYVQAVVPLSASAILSLHLLEPHIRSQRQAH